jgi:hypothetical protein
VVCLTDPTPCFPKLNTMTDDTIRLLELLQTRGAGNSLKELSKVVLQRLMKFEVEGVIELESLLAR